MGFQQDICCGRQHATTSGAEKPVAYWCAEIVPGLACLWSRRAWAMKAPLTRLKMESGGLYCGSARIVLDQRRIAGWGYHT
jgi:hypothetical protein